MAEFGNRRAKEQQMISRQTLARKLILALLLAVLPGRLPAQEKAADEKTAKLVARLLKTDESGPPAVLLPRESEEVQRMVALELVQRRQRLPDAVVTLLSLDEKRFKPDRGIKRFSRWGIRGSTETILRSLGPATRTRVSPVIAEWLLSDSERRREFAAAVLRNLDGLPRNAVPNLIRATRSRNSQAKADACLALGWVEPPPRNAEVDIRKCLADLDPDLQYAPAAALLAIDNNDKEAMRILIDTLVKANDGLAYEGMYSPLASEARQALNKAGPGLLRFSERWRKEKGLKYELGLLLQRREREVVPILMGWLRNNETPEILRLSIMMNMGSVSVITPEIRDTLIAVATAPPQDGAHYHGRISSGALSVLCRAGGFDPVKIAPFAARNPGWPSVETFMETLATCSDDRKEQAEALRRYIKHPHRPVRWYAKSQMARMGFDDPEVLEFVRELVTHERPDYRADGASLAQHLGQNSGLVADELFAVLEDLTKYRTGDVGEYVCESAPLAVAALGEKAVPGLVERLEHRHAAIRALAARTLGLIRDPAAVDPLARVLTDSDPDVEYWRYFRKPEKVRIEALKALANIGGPHTQHLLPEFEKLLEHDWSRPEATHAIAQVGRPGHPLLLHLMRISQDNADGKIDKALTHAFSRLSPDDGFALIGLRYILERKKRETPGEGLTTFFNSMKLIQSMGPKAKPLIPVLKEIVEDEELVYYASRAYAAAALAVIDKENPRWQALVDRWQSGRFLKDVSGFPTTERTIWYHLTELEEQIGLLNAE